MQPIIIDVRDRNEYLAEHIPDSIHLPLADFALTAPALLKALKDKDVYVMCLSGKRAGLACQSVQAMGLGSTLKPFPGGLTEWKKQGKATIRNSKAPLPLMRQVQLGAGLLVLTASTLIFLGHMQFVFLSAFVGAGLTLAGSTGFCGMAIILAKMPWNRVPKN